MRTLLLAVSIFVCGIAQAQVQFFTGSWEQLFEKSKTENKPVMVFLKSPSCGYCKYTEKNIFNRDTAYEYLNENYICYEVDLTTPFGKKLRKEYQIEMTPTYLFFNAKGKMVRVSEGFHNALELKQEASKANRKLKF